MKKKELRKAFTERRLALSPRQLEQISEAICEAAFRHFQLEGKKISIFLPIERKKEINTYKIWEKALLFGAEVAVPKVDMKTGEIKHILFESEAQLEISEFGIPEPKKGRIVAAEHFDVVFVPLLAIDENGYRVGYGGGYYDRFLVKCSARCQFVGLSHFDEFQPGIEDLYHGDVRMDACLTPENIYRFG